MAYTSPQARYNATHVKQVKLALNIKTDKDIIEHLAAVENVNGYIKELIRQDMKKPRR